MAFVPTLGGASARIEMSLFQRPVYNILNFDSGAGNTPAELTQLGNLLLDVYEEALLPFLSVQLQLTGVTVRDLSVQDGAQQAVQPPAPIQGGAGGASLPASIAFCVTHRTALIGRSRRGRSYMPGLIEAAVTGNFLDQAYANGLATGFNALRGAVAAGTGFEFVVLSTVSNGDDRAFGVTTPVTLSVARDLRVDSQRRRVGR